jgi:hypothetical protein
MGQKLVKLVLLTSTNIYCRTKIKYLAESFLGRCMSAFKALVFSKKSCNLLIFLLSLWTFFLLYLTVHLI